MSAHQNRWKGSGDSRIQAILEEHPAAEDEGVRQWDREYELRLFDWAAAQVRGGFEEKTWQAFWQTMVEGKHPKQVAEALAISVGAVYIAKSRVLARLQQQIQQIQVE